MFAPDLLELLFLEPEMSSILYRSSDREWVKDGIGREELPGVWSGSGMSVQEK